MSSQTIGLPEGETETGYPGGSLRSVVLGRQLNGQAIRVGKVDPPALDLGLDVDRAEFLRHLAGIEVGDRIAVVMHAGIPAPKKGDNVGATIQKAIVGG